MTTDTEKPPILLCEVFRAMIIQDRVTRRFYRTAPKRVGLWVSLDNARAHVEKYRPFGIEYAWSGNTYAPVIDSPETYTFEIQIVSVNP